MIKRELIDRTHLLEEIKKLQKSPWYNYGKNGMAIIRALYNERKEAVEVVRDLCVNDEPTITEQEIVKPYLEKLKAEIAVEEREEDFMNDYSAGWNSCLNTVISKIDNLLSEQETKHGSN